MARSIAHYDKTGAGAITAKVWADILAGTVGAAERFWVQNDGDVDLGVTPLALMATLEQVGDNDGVSRMRWGLDVDAVVPPYTLTGVEGGAGGTWGAPGLVYYRLTAINATGESQGSVELAVNVADITKVVTLAWVLPTGATGVRVYRSATPGVYADPALVAAIGAVATYDDVGGATIAGALPAANTTAGAAPDYGTAPALGTGPLNFGELLVGQAKAYWVNRDVPGASDELGNDRMSRRHFAEV